MFLMYVLNNKGTDEYKIGITNNLNRRLSQLQTGCPNELVIVKTWSHYRKDIIEKYERTLHRYFTKCGCRIRENGEWFRLRKPDIYQLCKPQSIAEQNEMIENFIKML